MARHAQPYPKLLAASILAGAATLIIQGAAEKGGKDRSFVYKDLFKGSQLVIIFVLIVLSVVAPGNKLSNATAFAAAVALRYADLMSTDAEFAAKAGAGVIVLEALTLTAT